MPTLFRYSLILVLTLCSGYYSLQAQPSVILSQRIDSLSSFLAAADYSAVRKQLAEIDSAALEQASPAERFRYYASLSEYHLQMRDLPRSKNNYNIALKLATQLKDSLRLVEVYSGLGSVASLQGEYNLALEHYQKALPILSTSKGERYYTLLMNMSTAHLARGKYDQALSDLMEAERYFSAENLYLKLAHTENNIGEIYRQHLSEVKPARHHYQRAIEANKKAGSRLGLAMNYHNLANLFLMMEEIDSAKSLAQQSLQLKREGADSGSVTSALYLMGEVCAAQGDLDEASQYFQRSLSMAQEYGLMQGVYYNNLSLGHINRQRQRNSESINYYQQALALAKQSEQLELEAEVHHYLYLVERDRNQPAAALVHLEKASEMRDSVHQLQQEQQLSELRSGYEAELAAAENRSLRNREKSQSRLLKTQRQILYSTIAIAVILLLGGSMLSIILRQRNKAYAKATRAKADLDQQYQQTKQREEELRQANDLKNKILSVLGHDLRTPLAGINALLSSITASTITRQELEELFSHLKRETDISLRTLQEILAWSRMQMNDSGMQPERLSPPPLLNDVLKLYDPMIRAKNLEVDLQVQVGTVLWADRNQMRSIMANLISNAIKFSEEGQLIKIKLQQKEQFSQLSIIDEGQGIAVKQLEALNRGDKVNSAAGTKGEKGTGVGLRIIRDFIYAHGGTIKFSNNPAGGSRVDVCIPLPDSAALAATA